MPRASDHTLAKVLKLERKRDDLAARAEATPSEAELVRLRMRAWRAQVELQETPCTSREVATILLRSLNSPLIGCGQTGQFDEVDRGTVGRVIAWLEAQEPSG